MKLRHHPLSWALGLLLGALSSTPHAAMTSPDAPPQRLFISGHSLTDPPLPGFLVTLAGSAGASDAGAALQWNMQSMPGSSIKQRMLDDFTHGLNRDGRNLRLRDEWRAPQTVTGGRYDTLLIAEQHGVLSAMTWQDTARSLAATHEAFIRASPGARTWFYESWLGLDDMQDPARWIAYERAASPVWRCLATQRNRQLQAAGRTERIESLPAGLALAALIERATSGQPLPGVSAATRGATIARLVSDDVHLTPLGNFYMASVVHAYLWQRSPEGAPVPPELDAVAARALQSQAWQFVAPRLQSKETPWTMTRCREHLQEGFIAQHWNYVRDTQWSKDRGIVSRWWNWAKQRLAWARMIRAQNDTNPFAGS